MEDMSGKMTYRFSDMATKFGIVTKPIEVYAKAVGVIEVDAKGILMSNTAYKNGAIKIFKGSNCHVQNVNKNMITDKYIKCSDETLNELKRRVMCEHSFNIIFNEDILIESLSLATNIVYGTGKSEWSDRFFVSETNRKLGDYFICKYTLPTEENLKKLKRFWLGEEVVKEAEHALTSDKTEEAVKANEAVVAEDANHAETADEASKLSDEQKLEIKQQAENIAQQTYEENKRKEQLELEEKLKTFVYKYQTFEDYNDKELEYNKQKLESALTMLSRDKTVYVTGKSRSGKTFLCREIAGKFCNIDTTDFENHAKFAHNLMWIKATMSEEVFIQKFAEFCVHNKNAEKCLIVINEAKKDNLYNLLPMWEKMDADGKKYKDFLQEGLTFECNGVSIEVPKGLCILANVADGQNIDDLEQVLNRFNHNRIDMNDISEDLVDISKFTNIPLKVLSLLSEIQSEIIEETENDSKSFIVVYLLKYDKLNTLKKCLKSIKKDLYLWEDDDRVTELESYISKLEDNSDELQF